MEAAVLFAAFIQPVEPPAFAAFDPPPIVARADPYAALYARIQAGEKLVVYSGVRMPVGTVGAVEVQIPGEEPGIYWCWLRPDGKTAIEPLANTPGAVGNPGMGSRSQEGGHAPGVVSRPKASGQAFRSTLDTPAPSAVARSTSSPVGTGTVRTPIPVLRVIAGDTDNCST